MDSTISQMDAVDKSQFDVLSIGRVSMDLFAEQIGAEFVDIEGFETGVGGSPSNIAIGTSRLGLRVALLTAVGDDEVGKFVLRYLQGAGIDTGYIPQKPGKRTGMAVVGVQPPDRFPLVFYREDPADIYLTVDDAAALPIAHSRTVMLSGTALSRGTCRDATLFAAEEARRHAATTFIDLDLRPDQWSHPRAYGINMRTILPLVDVVIGTEEEFYAALAPDPGPVMNGQAVPENRRDELESLLQQLIGRDDGPATLIVKRGASGATVFSKGCVQNELGETNQVSWRNLVCDQPVFNAPFSETASSVDVPGFPVEILNTVGAGDAFASGLLYGFTQNWDWYKCVRMGNACGALVVTRHGCGTAMPTLQTANQFITERGGF